MLCDIILLNFLKGAEHYKARKFEEVSGEAGTAVGLEPCWGALGRAGPKGVGVWGWGLHAEPPGCRGCGAGADPAPVPCPQVPEASVPPASTSPTTCAPGAMGDQSREKQSTDSGTSSLGL